MTPDQIKAKFRREGRTFTQLATERGWPRNAVYRVLNGQDKANYGRAHEIAVALGLKDGAAAEAEQAAA